jgi:hypothetical protein
VTIYATCRCVTLNANIAGMWNSPVTSYPPSEVEGGYWFEYTDPWPGDWSYDDDVYVDEIDGEYYLIDPVHPGIRVFVIVVG